MDPLTLLCDFIKQKKHVICDAIEKQIILDQTKFPIDTEVNLKTAKGVNLRLGQLWFYLKNVDKKIGEYAMACKKEKLEQVERQDYSSIQAHCIPKGVEFKPATFEFRLKRKEASDSAGDAHHSRDQHHKRSRKSAEHEGDKSSSAAPTAGDEDSMQIDSSSADQKQPLGDSKQVQLDPVAVENAKASFLKFIDLIANNNDSQQQGDDNNDKKLLNQEKQLVSKFEDAAAWNDWNQYLFEPDRQQLHKTVKKREVPIAKKTKYKQQGKSAGAFQVRFDTIVDVLAQIHREEKQAKMESGAASKQRGNQYDSSAAGVNSGAGSQGQLQQAPLQHQPVDYESVWKRQLGMHEDFGINTMGSNMDLGFKIADADGVVNSSSQQQQQQAPIVQQKTPLKSNSSSNNNSKSNRAGNADVKKKKIIVVPAALSSLITMYNVKEFLEDGLFVTNEDKKKVLKEKPIALTVKHVRDNKTSEEFMVIDNPQKLSREDQSRIVAVFTAGQAWQFKGWLSENPNPTDVLSKYKSFYLAYSGETIPANIQNWPVKVLKIGKEASRRHGDSIVVRDFWNLVDPQ